MIYTVFDVVKSTLTTNTFPNSWGGPDNRDYLFFQNFPKFYNFYTKSATGGLYYYYGIVFK